MTAMHFLEQGVDEGSSAEGAVSCNPTCQRKFALLHDGLIHFMGRAYLNLFRATCHVLLARDR